jgi:hypothetical protein
MELWRQRDMSYEISRGYNLRHVTLNVRATCERAGGVAAHLGGNTAFDTRACLRAAPLSSYARRAYGTPRSLGMNV